MKINYIEYGKGPDVVLLHGWGGSLKSLENLQIILADKGFRVTALDLPGFGLSEEPSVPWGLEEYADFLLKFIRDMKIEKPVIIGHSFGGKLALKTAIKYPSVLSCLVIIDSSGIYPKNSSKKSFMKILTKIGGIFMLIPPFFLFKPIFRKLFYKFVVRESDYLKTSGIMRDTFKKVIEMHLNDDLKKIKAQTLIIWGENDKETPLWQGEKLARSIHNSRLEVVKDAGHNLPLKNPEVVAELISKNINC